MPSFAWAALLLAGIPLVRAWYANRQTSLVHTLNWAVGAWALWGWAAWQSARPGADAAPARYLALCFTACAAVAVLGARRPGAGPWNFVVVGFLAVELLPLLHAVVTAGFQLAWYRAALPAAAVAVGMLNYLPTRLAAGALLVGAGCGFQLAGLTTSGDVAGRSAELGWWALAVAPWAAWAGVRRPAGATAADRLWLDFRDRFGLVWGQRLRDQFNRAAANAGLPVALHWQGMRRKAGAPGVEAAAAEQAVATLQSLMKRFGSGEPPPPGEDQAG